MLDNIFDPFGKNQLPGILELSSLYSLSVEQKSTFSPACVQFTMIKVLLLSWLGPYSNLTPKRTHNEKYFINFYKF